MVVTRTFVPVLIIHWANARVLNYSTKISINIQLISHSINMWTSAKHVSISKQWFEHYRLVALFLCGVGVVLMWCWWCTGVVLVRCWCGVGVVLVWCRGWCGVGVVLVWCWCDVGVVLMWCWCDWGVVWLWWWWSFGVVLVWCRNGVADGVGVVMVRCWCRVSVM